MDEIAAARPEDVGLCSRRIERVAAWMQRQVADGRLSGIEVMIDRRGRTAFHRCHGKRDLARNADAAPDTIYRIYSMTKPLTAAAVMMLYEEGHFQLDDPVTRFLPEFAGQRVFTGGGYGAIMTEPAARDITFRDLLTHEYPTVDDALVWAIIEQDVPVLGVECTEHLRRLGEADESH